jgi:hypothetical protein
MTNKSISTIKLTFKPDKFRLLLQYTLTILVFVIFLVVTSYDTLTNFNYNLMVALFLISIIPILTFATYFNNTLIVSDGKIFQKNKVNPFANKEINLDEVTRYEIGYVLGLVIHTKNPIQKIHFKYPKNPEEIIKILPAN